MNKLKEIRFFKRISQFKLGVGVAIAPSKLSLIENDLVAVKPDEAKRIADFLGLPVEDIFPSEKAEVAAEKKKQSEKAASK